MLGEAELSSISADLVNGWFNKRMKIIWEYAPWTEICPTEQRPIGINLAQGKNDISNDAWTPTNVETEAANLNTTDVQDPWFTYLADKLLETTDTGTHRLEQMTGQASNFTNAEVYFRGGLNRDWGYISTNGTNAPIAYFNFTEGTVGTTDNIQAVSITEVGNGWYRCRISHQSPYPGTTYYVGIADADGSDSYAGASDTGVYIAGFRVHDSTIPLIPYLETDLDDIGDFLDIRNNTPYSTTNYASMLTYDLVEDGAIYFINYGGGYNRYGRFGQGGRFESSDSGSVSSVESLNPYVKYRRRVPHYNGEDYVANKSYMVDDQVYFPTTGRFYRCVHTTRNNVPTDTTFWSELQIPRLFFEYVISGVFADWLKQNGQHGKSDSEERHSTFLLLRELDLLERQQRQKTETHVTTHLNSQYANY